MTLVTRIHMARVAQDHEAPPAARAGRPRALLLVAPRSISSQLHLSLLAGAAAAGPSLCWSSVLDPLVLPRLWRGAERHVMPCGSLAGCLLRNMATQVALLAAVGAVTVGAASITAGGVNPSRLPRPEISFSPDEQVITVQYNGSTCSTRTHQVS